MIVVPGVSTYNCLVVCKFILDLCALFTAKANDRKYRKASRTYFIEDPKKQVNVELSVLWKVLWD